jgi:hypothetical protein
MGKWDASLKHREFGNKEGHDNAPVQELKNWRGSEVCERVQRRGPLNRPVKDEHRLDLTTD